MAQFDHPDLGGMGQWTAGGMTMIGDMFNAGLNPGLEAGIEHVADHRHAAGGPLAHAAEVGMVELRHPLGGMGQWTAGGMTMIGDMFNAGLKARVVALCDELAPPGAADPRAADR
jgi:hypothetical protein